MRNVPKVWEGPYIQMKRTRSVVRRHRNTYRKGEEWGQKVRGCSPGAVNGYVKLAPKFFKIRNRNMGQFTACKHLWEYPPPDHCNFMSDSPR